jgi:hypothetical protein
MRRQLVSAPALRLAGHTTMGIALGLMFCLSAAWIDPSNITSLITHDAEPWTAAVVVVGFFASTFGVGAALTGIVLNGIGKR